MTDTILPPNSSALERDIEESGGRKRLEAIDIPVGKLWNPQTIPAAILPYLAWGLSVDTWDNQWPDNIKRQVIAASVEVHRKKGTVGAVKKAIAAIGIDVDFEEWFQNGGIPHTFSITAWSDNNRDEEGKTKLLPAAFNDINKAVNTTKPVRAHFELRFGSRVPLDAGLGFDSNVTARINGITEIIPYPTRPGTEVGGVYNPNIATRLDHVNEIMPYVSKTDCQNGVVYSQYVTVRTTESIEIKPYASTSNSVFGAGGSIIPGGINITLEI
ncbi:MAG: phage tail protein [Rickettsiaceae bacterium]|jgi:phage tail P2-like protein|nr:phage tail protein [Rickettsiaceae bacterium]